MLRAALMNDGNSRELCGLQGTKEEMELIKNIYTEKRNSKETVTHS